MIDGLGFCVIYRARVAPDKEQQYVAAWSKITRLLGSERGALGSRLHRGNDGLWYAYAQWASAEARRAAFSLGPVDAQAEADVVDSILEYFPEILLDPVEDQLVPMSALALNGSPGPRSDKESA